MADYCTIADVRALLVPGHGIDDQIGKPVNATVTTWITRVTNQVNVALSGAGTTLPVTDTDLLGDLALLVSREVAYQIMVVRGGISDPKTKPLWASWHDEFRAFLEDLESGETASSASPSSYTMNAPDSPDSSVNPVFTRDQARNW